MYPDEFHVVSRRKSVKIGKKVLILRNNSDISWKGTDFDRNGVLRRVRAAVEELRESSYKKVIFDGLKQSLSLLNFDGFSEFICYGLGQFRENSSSKYQLALLVTLQEHYKCKIHIYDPKFSEDELEILKTLGLEINVKMNNNLRTIRSLISEIRHSTHGKKMKDNIMVQYILDQARAHRETSEVLCKAREELHNLAQTYLCYLSSLRRYNEIQTQYAGKGERSLKETADLVGFKLPHDPK
ncbi:uncharacterized protein LOC105702685 isoform X3 [Orussus abietinus]|uniref:uncharacterized protein LOC105702685 isoform X3 n=2 Tax=Orussus abietinus TaxID=222816 RepID=UPI000C715FB1|nr:uncharacterized protein LOC105702685 isoform X3 [Orussus abietinus]